MRLFLFFSHKLTPEQAADAQNALGVTEFVALPEALQTLWSNVPADAAALREYVQPLQTWLAAHAQAGDYVLVQGDYGAVWLLVQHALAQQLVPIYSTTAREVQEVLRPDGSIEKKSIFAHVRFRQYNT